jgi:hypothetical protein
MEIDQPIAHLVDESQPTPNNMTNGLMKDTQQNWFQRFCARKNNPL